VGWQFAGIVQEARAPQLRQKSEQIDTSISASMLAAGRTGPTSVQIQKATCIEHSSTEKMSRICFSETEMG
jgi:hypothetical protein